MFWLCAIVFFVIEFYSVFPMRPIVHEASAYIQLAALSVCGLHSAAAHNSKKTYTTASLFVASLIIAGTNLACPAMDARHYQIMVACLFALLVWSSARPYDYYSDELSSDTVCLAFYKGSKGTSVMCLCSLIGLPVSSLSVVMGPHWLKPVKETMRFETHLVTSMHTRNYVVVDTKIPLTFAVEDVAKDINGAATADPRSLFLRARCVANLKPLLAALGEEWAVKGLEIVPSLYLYRALRNRRAYVDNRRETPTNVGQPPKGVC